VVYGPIGSFITMYAGPRLLDKISAEETVSVSFRISPILHNDLPPADGIVDLESATIKM
jgi:hypothetical protein